MGISLEGKGFGCWRNPEHRGRRPERLVQALLNCSWAEACRITGSSAPPLLRTDADFAEDVGDLLAPTETPKLVESKKVLKYPKNIHRMWPGQNLPLRPSASAFYDYLVTKRRYTRLGALYLAQRYKLRFALIGPFRYRLIIPVRFPEGLVNWTGRAIGSSPVRYRTLSSDPEKAEAEGLPIARMSIERTLWNYEELLEGGNILWVCEGPLDAIRMDYFGEDKGERGTCIFGLGNLSRTQVELLSNVAPRFKRRVLVLDPDAALDVLRMYSRLEPLGFETGSLPRNVEDPADLYENEYERFAAQFRAFK